MPLSKKELSREDGTELANTFRQVQTVTLHPREKCGEAIFYGYASEQAMVDKKDPVHTFHYPITNKEYDEYFSADTLSQEGNNAYKAAYNCAKKHPFFNDSEDVTRSIVVEDQETTEAQVE